jgi:hypothetical protein
MPEENENLLAEIRDILRSRQRMEDRNDFSLAQLAGAIVQVCAVALAFWGFLDLTDVRDGYPVVVGRLLGAIFAQLLALTLFTLRK